MTFTGTLIEDLMATQERAERNARTDRALSVESSAVESPLIEPWLAAAQENRDYDPKFIGVA